jgi:hypothetical protein
MTPITDGAIFPKSAGVYKVVTPGTLVEGSAMVFDVEAGTLIDGSGSVIDVAAVTLLDVPSVKFDDGVG